MRLSKKEIDLLKEELASLSQEAKLYLFGSRVDDTKRGGDIDLLAISKSPISVFGILHKLFYCDIIS